MLLSFALLMPQLAEAQASAGITGTITDPTGAVISGAGVTITNEATSISNSTITTDTGTYSFKGLLPGHYKLTVTATGFKKNVRSGITIEVSTSATVDVALETGAAAETVQVTSNSISLNTTQPEMGSTIEPVVVRALPVEVNGRGRQVDQLQFMAPGTTGDTFSHRISGGVDFEQEIVYNGIPAPQPETEGYTTNFNPPFEMVDEARVQRSTFSAQYGLGQGALTYQMHSGSNQYHGSLFEINRNSFFDSVGFFNGPAWNGSSTPPKDRENNYGFAVGGPIWIPHMYNGRNRTFGFYSQEWYKQNNLDTDVSTVPTAQEKTGDFTDLFDADGNLIPIYDPSTGQQFQCGGVLNVICANQISTTSSTLIPFIPDPDRPGSGPGNRFSNKSYTPFINPHIQHVWGFTIDHNISDKQSIHWSQWRNSYSNYSFDNHPLVVAPNPLNSMKFEPALGSVFLLNYSYTINPHLVMTAGAGWVGEINNQFNITKGTTFPAVEDENIPPNITFGPNSNQCNSNTYTCWGTSGSWFQSINRKLGIALVNNWLWTKGRNTFNIGLDYRRSYQDDNEEQTEGGHFNFSTSQTAQPGGDLSSTGNEFASFLIGLPDSANRSNSQELKLRNRVFAPYIQDDIKMSPKLTVNVGLRWDIMVPFTEENNNVVFFNPDKIGTDPYFGGLSGTATKFGNCTGCAGFDRADIVWTHFGPRFGFAYQVNTKTVVQGGLSVAFLNGGAYEYGTNKVAVNYGNLLTGSYTRNTSLGNSSTFGNWDGNTIPALSPTPFNPTLGAGTQINALSRKDGAAPYSQQWNVNLQRELPFNALLTAAWVGNRIIHLPSQLNEINQLDPSILATYGNTISACQNAQVPGSNQSVFTDTFSTTGGANGCAIADGLGGLLPYANFAADFGGSSTVIQALTPYPQYSKIFNNFEAKGTTYYQGAQISVEKRFSDGLAFLAGYTLSRLWDNTNSGFSSFTAGGVNKYNQKPEWAVSGSDEPQTFKLTGTYELPIGPGKKFVNNRKLGNLVGGWQMGWILDYEAGTAIGITSSSASYPNAGNRPDRNASVKLNTASYSKARDAFLGKISTAQMWDPTAFTATPNYVLGNAIRNYSELRNPGYYMENLNAKKKFFLGERFTGILSVDYFNAFNRTRFQNPDSNASDSNFGQVTSQGSQISNRQGQVSFRLEF